MQGIHILLVDDNEGDILLTREALEECKIVNQISIATDGVQAVNFLRKKPPYDDTDMPDLILLDLSFPKESGFEVLRYWKSNPKLQSIHIVVWTVMGETEKKLCKFFGVDHVVPKWGGPKELEAVLSTFSDGKVSSES